MKKRLFISAIGNIGIFAMVIAATVIMLTGYRFMGDDIALTSTKVEVLKFFTVDSNLLMGAIAAVLAVLEILFLCGKITQIPAWAYTLKLVGTVGVVLTMLTTVLFLAPFLVEDYWSLFRNANLFFHLVVPLVCLLVYLFGESTTSVRWRYSFWGMVPMGMYAIFYTINALSHIQDGKVPYAYDWYGFVQGGVSNMAFVLPIMLLGTYLICYLLWLGNRAMGKLYAKGQHADTNTKQL